jgi:hypothetical protein
LQHICSTRFGRHYLNPLPIALSAYWLPYESAQYTKEDN